MIYGTQNNLNVTSLEKSERTIACNAIIMRTGDDGKPPVILYDYQPSRNGDHAVVFLKDFKGFVHSDGYSGYNKLTGITRCGCWAHYSRSIIIPEEMLNCA